MLKLKIFQIMKPLLKKPITYVIIVLLISIGFNLWFTFSKSLKGDNEKQILKLEVDKEVLKEVINTRKKVDSLQTVMLSRLESIQKSIPELEDTLKKIRDEKINDILILDPDSRLGIWTEKTRSK